MERRKPLRGKTVVVIGGMERHSNLHRVDIESLGGKMLDHIVADNMTKTKYLRRSDYIVILTKGTTHKLFDRLRFNEDREKFIYVNSLGKGAIRMAFLKLLEVQANAADRESG